MRPQTTRPNRWSGKHKGLSEIERPCFGHLLQFAADAALTLFAANFAPTNFHQFVAPPIFCVIVFRVRGQAPMIAGGELPSTA